MTPQKPELYYDPYDVAINQDPYPVFKRLREEKPLFYNEKHDFWAASRYDDVVRGLADAETFSSAKGAIIEMISADFPIPKGVFIFEDPPLHTVHRNVVRQVFAPRRIAELEPQIREYCQRSLDPLVGSGDIDFIRDLGAQMPMRVIGMLVGIPEEDQEKIRDIGDAALRTEDGKPMEYDDENFLNGDLFGDYVDWRAKNPSDDLMTQLMQTEFEDETGTVRKLTRDEILLFCHLIAGAGNETTGRLIGWTGKVLSDHPDQRRELVADPSLIPNAIEELLRFEPPAPHVARYMLKDAEIQGQTVPAGSTMLFLTGSANRDESQFPDGERFDIHRKPGAQATFGRGLHFCLGAALARLEGRIALEEVLKRFPDWEVDMSGAKLAPTSTVRGWETLPARIL